MSTLPRPLARSMFRSALRASGNGRWTDTFGYTDLAVVSGVGPAYQAGQQDTVPQLALPRDAVEVRRAIRGAFERPAMPEGTTASTAFKCLRNASLTAHTLHPKPADLLPSFPSFSLPSLPLLPGERSQFHFFEPRYRRMCDIALGRADAPPVLPWLSSGSKVTKPTTAGIPPKKPQWSGPDMRYVHIHEPRGLGRDVASGVLCTIMDHKTLPDGRFVVTCLAGPRVKVLHSFAEELAEGEPLTHVHVALMRDSNESDEVNTASDEQMALWRAECVGLLEQLGHHTGCLTGRALPSANDSEALAFYVLALLAGGTDHAVHLRRQVLSDMNTQPRLEFALAMLREANATFIKDAARSSSLESAEAAAESVTASPDGASPAAEGANSSRT